MPQWCGELVGCVQKQYEHLRRSHAIPTYDDVYALIGGEHTYKHMYSARQLICHEKPQRVGGNLWWRSATLRKTVVTEGRAPRREVVGGAALDGHERAVGVQYVSDCGCKICN